MHLPKHEIPTKINVPGAHARQLPGFGTADGTLSAEYFSLATGTDIKPLLEGLEDDLCQAPHWGYLISGEVLVTYADASTERCTGGDVFHWPAGHSVRVEQEADVVLFSPQAEHSVVLDHMLGRLASA